GRNRGRLRGLPSSAGLRSESESFVAPSAAASALAVTPGAPGTPCACAGASARMSTSRPAPSDIAKGSWRGTLKSSAHDLSGTCPARAGIILEINELRRYPAGRPRDCPTTAKADARGHAGLLGFG